MTSLEKVKKFISIYGVSDTFNTREEVAGALGNAYFYDHISASELADMISSWETIVDVMQGRLCMAGADSILFSEV